MTHIQQPNLKQGWNNSSQRKVKKNYVVTKICASEIAGADLSIGPTRPGVGVRILWPTCWGLVPSPSLSRSASCLPPAPICLGARIPSAEGPLCWFYRCSNNTCSDNTAAATTDATTAKQITTTPAWMLVTSRASPQNSIHSVLEELNWRWGGQWTWRPYQGGSKRHLGGGEWIWKQSHKPEPIPHFSAGPTPWFSSSMPAI